MKIKLSHAMINHIWDCIQYLSAPLPVALCPTALVAVGVAIQYQHESWEWHECHLRFRRAPVRS